MTTQLPKERLTELAHNILACHDVSPGEIKTMASVLLAAYEQEPVAYMCEGDDGREYNGHNEFSCGGRGIPLYTHPAPSIPAAVPDEREAFNAWNNDIDCPLAGRDAKTAAWLGWSKRAAMLQAEPVTTSSKLENGENCWSCGKYFTYVQHSSCDGYCPHCDSPVDLDDEEEQTSKLVPAEPTEEMISIAWREAVGKCDHETIKRIYATMLAAAPKGV